MLSKQEELRYLTDLLMEASRWTRSEGETLTGVELEIQDRIRRLTGVETVDSEGYAQSVVERGLARQQSKNKNTHVGQVRVCIDGKPKWFPESMCMQVPFPKSKTGKKWILRSEVPDGQA